MSYESKLSPTLAVVAIVAIVAALASGCALLEQPPVTAGGSPPTVADLGAQIGAVAIDDAGTTVAAIAGTGAKLIDKASGVVSDIGAADPGSGIAVSNDASRTFWTSGGDLLARIDSSGTTTIVPGAEAWAASGDGSAVVATTAAVLDPSDTDAGSSVYLVDVDSGLPIWLGPVPASTYTLGISDGADQVLVANDPGIQPGVGDPCPGSTAEVFDVASTTWSTVPCASSSAQISDDGSKLWVPRTECQFTDDCTFSLVAIDVGPLTQTAVAGNTSTLSLDGDGSSAVFRLAEQGFALFAALWQMGQSDGTTADLSVEAPFDPGSFTLPFPADTEFHGISADGGRLLAQRASGGVYDTEVALTDGTVVFTAAVGTAAPTAVDPFPVLSDDGSTVAVPAGSILTIDD
ncbi:MAG: hypothetical protein ACR2OH_09275 [Microthrixaceae bacterium]